MRFCRRITVFNSGTEMAASWSGNTGFRVGAPIPGSASVEDSSLVPVSIGSAMLSDTMIFQETQGVVVMEECTSRQDASP